MTGILGVTELLLETELNSEQRQYQEMVQASAKALLDTINEVLDFSKIEARMLVLEKIEFRLHDVMASALKSLALGAHQRGIDLLYRESQGVPLSLIGDPGRLRQLLVNLVGNAIKFTEKGEVLVEVEPVGRVGEDLELHFVVTDTGIGIPQERLDTIFGAFEQADGSTTRRFGGTGLGLAISKQLAELMSGRIWAESTLRVGSAFHFTACFGEPPRGRRGEAQPAMNPRPLRGHQVLVVDDHEPTRSELKVLVEGWGGTVVTAEHGVAALAAQTSLDEAGKPFSLILSDLHMHGMDGFELLQEVNRRSTIPPPRTILITSAGRRGDGERCRELGAAGYLLKPVLPSELLSAIQVALGSAVGSEEEPTLVTRHSLRERRPPLHILLAEDNVVNQQLVSSILKKKGHSLELARDGSEAVALASKGSFDLVFMDVQMPTVDGLEATRQIRRMEGETEHRLPIVALTAHAWEEQKEECLAAGMDSFLSKPIDREALDDILDHFGKEVPEAGDLAPPKGTSGGRAGADGEDRRDPARRDVSPAERGRHPESSSSLPEEGLFDMDQILELVGGEEDLIGEIVGIFLEDSTGLLGRIRSGLDAGNPEAVERAAHQLKGASANFRAPQVSEPALRIEEGARAGDLEAASEHYPALERALFQLQAAMRPFGKSDAR
jgi:CheY-like chemotaxis protein